MARTSIPGLTLPLLLLSACQGEEPAPAAATAGGEILPASVSDAMLPLDRVRSQPPLAPRPSAAKDEERSEGPVADKAEVPSSPAPSPAPAATPSAE